MSPLKLFGKKNKDWFIRNADKDISGPFNDQELKDKAADGSLSPDDKVSNDQKKWTAAPRVKLLKGLFPDKPAPTAAIALDLPVPEVASEPKEPVDVVVTEQAGDAMEVLLQDSPAPGEKDAADKAAPVVALPADDKRDEKDVAPAVKVTPISEGKTGPAAKVKAVKEATDSPTAKAAAVKAAPADADNAQVTDIKDAASTNPLPAAKPVAAPKAEEASATPKAPTPKIDAKEEKKPDSTATRADKAASMIKGKKPTPKGPAPKLKAQETPAAKEPVKADKTTKPLPGKPKAAEPAPKEEKKAEPASAKRQLKGKKPKPKPAPATQEKSSPVPAKEEKKVEAPPAKAETKPATAKKEEIAKKPDATRTQSPLPASAKTPVSPSKPLETKPLVEAPVAATKPRAESNHLIELERQIEDLTAQLDNANDQANRDKRSLATKVEVLESKLQAIKDREAAIQRDHDHEKNKLKRETDAVARKLASMSEDLEARKNQLFTLRNDSRDEIQALRATNAELKEQNDALQISLQEEQELMAELRRAHHILTTTTDNEKGKLSEQIHHLQENAESSATILEDAWNQLEKQKRQIAEMFSKEELERREAEWLSETERARSEASGISTRLEQQKVQAAKREDTLLKKIEEKETASAALEDSLTKTRAEVDEQRKQEALLTSKADDLAKTLSELETKLTSADANAKQQAEELETLRDRHVQAEKKNDEFAKELTKTRNALAEAEKAGAELAGTLGGQIDAIRKELVAQTEAAPAKTNGALADADIQRLKERIFELRDDAERATTLKVETEQLRSSLEEVESKSKDFKRNLNEAEEKYMILEQKLVLTEGRETRLLKRLDQVESLMKLLRAQME